MDHIPEPMTGHRCLTDGKYLYVFGGYDNNKYENGIWFPEKSMIENQIIQDGNIRTKDDFSWRFEGEIKFHCCYQHGWKLDLTTEIWSKMVNDRTQQFGSASGSFDMITEESSSKEHNVGIYVAGTNFPWHGCKPDVIAVKLDKQSDKLTSKTIFRMPYKMYGHASCFDHETQKLYLFGGIAGAADTDIEGDPSNPDFPHNMVEWSNDFWELDIHSKTIEKIETESFSVGNIFDNQESYVARSAPDARMRAEMVVYDQKVFLLGGNNRTITFGLDKIDYYDIKLKKWVKDIATKPEKVEQYSDFPRARCRFGHAMYKNRYLFIVGGEDLGDSTDRLHQDCWRLDLKTLQWNFVANLPIPTTFMSCALTEEGCLYRKYLIDHTYSLGYSSEYITDI